MKKLLALLLVCAVVFVGCTKTEPVAESTTGEESSAVEGESSPETSETVASGQTYKIGVIQLVQHDALDSAYKGFVDGLAEAGYVDGENITIDLQNAQGEIANTNTIAAKLVNDNNDLILAIATPAAQAVANATDSIPVLITAVTDPAEAGLVATNEAPGGNITGTSDLTPVKEQIDILVKFAPETKIVGVMYCSNEANSHIQAAMAKEAIEALGMEYKEYTVSESNQIQQVATTAVGQVDALYTPTDNMIASAMVQISTIATEANIPLIGGEEAQVTNGALASYGVSYYELGKITATQAVEILAGGADPATMPIKYQEDHELTINEDTMKALGLTLPEGLQQ